MWYMFKNPGQKRAGETAQWGKALPIKTDNLRSSPQAHQVEGQSQYGSKLYSGSTDKPCVCWMYKQVSIYDDYSQLYVKNYTYLNILIFKKTPDWNSYIFFKESSNWGKWYINEQLHLTASPITF